MKSGHLDLLKKWNILYYEITELTTSVAIVQKSMVCFAAMLLRRIMNVEIS